MSKSKKYKIKQKDFRKLEKLAERIYNTVTVIDYFCRTQQEIEELYNLAPIVENLRRDSDTVNAYFILTTRIFKWHLKPVLIPFKKCSKNELCLNDTF